MYNEIFVAWQNEMGSEKLQSLPTDFYARAGTSLQMITEEKRAADKNLPKSILLEQEKDFAERMLHDLILLRYKKLSKIVIQDKEILSEGLAAEEKSLFKGFLPFKEAYQRFTQNLLSGQHIQPKEEKTIVDIRKRVVLRFLQDIPAIIGSDMKTYGPFLAEDVGSLPDENAKILVRQGLAKLIEST